jgi:hypothetical protein
MSKGLTCAEQVSPFLFYYIGYIQRVKVLQSSGVLAKAEVKRQRWSVVNAPPDCACKLL